MNRLQFSPSGESSTLIHHPYSSSTVFSPARREASHAFFGPLHYEPNYAYPLIVWLHGPGDNESQLQRVMPHVSLRNYVAAGPRGTVALDENHPERTGYRWRQSEDHILLAEQRVLDCIRIARSRYHVAGGRIFLAGLRCGGTMAFRLAMAHPQTFAGVISIGGGFPRGSAPLARLNDARRLPVLLASGRDSVAYPADRVCRDLRLLYSAGMSVHLRSYPLGDDLDTQVLCDVNGWIMEQVCGTRCEWLGDRD